MSLLLSYNFRGDERACVRTAFLRQVVVDLDHPSFSGARFRSVPLWQGGCDALVLSLGPCVATRDEQVRISDCTNSNLHTNLKSGPEQKLKDYVADLTAGELVLIKPPTATDELVPAAANP